MLLQFALSAHEVTQSIFRSAGLSPNSLEDKFVLAPDPCQSLGALQLRDDKPSSDHGVVV
jgi:hypothetical protein